jgi:hypothetical protein
LLAEPAARVLDNAGRQLRQLDKQTAIERQVDDALILDHLSGFGRFSAGERRVLPVFTRDDFSDLADFESDVDLGFLIQFQYHSLDRALLEVCSLEHQCIPSHGQQRDHIFAGGGGRDGSRQTSLLICSCDFGASNHGALRVGHEPEKCPGRRLRVGDRSNQSDSQSRKQDAEILGCHYSRLRLCQVVDNCSAPEAEWL